MAAEENQVIKNELQKTPTDTINPPRPSAVLLVIIPPSVTSFSSAQQTIEATTTVKILQNTHTDNAIHYTLPFK